jgi:ATP-dependent protease HslVU (ClpYQ) peptidase subunit
MTCIVGYIEGNKTYMACDSFIDWGWTRTEVESKIQPIPGLLLGVAGSSRTILMLKHMGISVPWGLDHDYAREEWLQNTFIPLIHDGMSKAKSLKSEGGIEAMDNTILAAFPGSLYVISGNFSLVRIIRPYHAIGSGAEVALGAMHSMQKSDLNPKQKLELALEAASQIAISVGPPFRFYEV